MKNKFIILSLLAILFLGQASLVLAVKGTTSDGKVNTTEDVMTVIESITNWMYTIFMALAVIMIVYAAFVYLTAGGIGTKKDSPAAVTRAHKMLVYAVVAIAVAILARGIVVVVKSIITKGV